jgi:hypothetical protein
LAAIWKMLDECAPGYDKKKQKHNWRVMWNGRTCRDLPLGGHGKRKKEIQRGKVKNLVRQLEVDLECAKSKLPQL